MTAEHNHPPHCCCNIPNLIDGLVMDGHSGKWHQTDEDDAHPIEQCTSECGLCPACPEHGLLAPAIECPQCHQPIGRPHTEFCTLAPDRVWDGTPTFEQLLGAPHEQFDKRSELLASIEAYSKAKPATAGNPPAGHHLVHSEAFIDQDDPRSQENREYPGQPAGPYTEETE